MSQLLFKTERQVPSDAQLVSHRLLLRAGLVKQVSSGIYSLTPTLYRVIQRISAIIRDEMNRVGGQELLLPLAQPASLWEESGRYETIDGSLARWKDRNGQAMVLAMTHEEAVTDLVKQFIQSYRQLPLTLYQLQTKFRDELRPRGGLVRLREFLMKDAYSFHADTESLDETYNRVLTAYESIYRRCGLDVLTVEADTGMMGGGSAHEFMLVTESGEDTLLVCPSCHYAANQEIAVAKKQVSEDVQARSQEIQRQHTPNATSIEAVAQFFDTRKSNVLKCVLYVGNETTLVLACIRGDLDVNDVKLANVLGMSQLRTLTHAEAGTYGFALGYVSPVNLTIAEEYKLVLDDSLVGCTHLIAGANELEYHYVNVSSERDLPASTIADIALVNEGDQCLHCSTLLQTARGIEVGNIFKLGTKYSEPMGATFTDDEGNVRPLEMGCYGIGITRLAASIVEQNHDAEGIIWPESVAPYDYHLIVLQNTEETRSVAEALVNHLGADRVLYDDRDCTAGVKFMDADLVGIPVRLTVSARSLSQGGVEVRWRKTSVTEVLSLEEVRAKFA